MGTVDPTTMRPEELGNRLRLIKPALDIASCSGISFDEALDALERLERSVNLPNTIVKRDPSATLAFHDLLDRMRAIHSTKNKDYADSATDPWLNFRMSEDIGVPAHIGAAIRMGDKYKRVNNLLRREWQTGEGAAVKDESIEDTLLDLAIYALIVLLMHREYKEKRA